MLTFSRLQPAVLDKSSSFAIYSSCTNLRVLKRFKHDIAKKKLYQTLGVEESCSDESLRLAFVHLAKKFHPDSGTLEADSIRFSEIESAYRQIKKIRSDERELEEKSSEIQEHDIKHTAPQHRHYLIHDVGIGTPSRRQRWHTIEKAQKAAENVMEHRLKKLQAEERNTLIGMDKQRAKDVKVRYGMDRLVEDLIQEAMSKGEFSDLRGMGKPLKNVTVHNPYVDFVTHKLNEVMIENGFTPEWIQLSKEIREETGDLRRKLTEARNELGPTPLSPEDERSWRNTIKNLRTIVNQINKKIDKYNLLVPVLQKQMLHVKLEVHAEEILSVPPVKERRNVKETNSSAVDYRNENLFDFLTTIFSRKIN